MSSKPRSSLFPVVGVKSLQGGLETLATLLTQIPPDSGLTFVIVPSRQAGSVQALRERVRLPIVQIDEPTALLPNHVYVLPPNQWSFVKASFLHLLEPDQVVDMLQANQERFLRMFQLGPFASFLMTEEELRITEVNDNFCNITGYRPEDVLGRSLARLDLFAGPTSPNDLMALVQNEGGFWEHELILRTREGMLRNVVASGERIEMDSASHVLVTFIDVTERRNLERQVQTVSERELRRIGQDLHDTLGQRMVGITYQARRLLNNIDVSDHGLRARLEDLVEQCEKAAVFTRNFAQLLAPQTVDEPYLEHAVRMLCHHTQDMFHVLCDFDVQLARPLKDEVVANSLYRIAQEATVNAARHANADHIHVAVRSEGNRAVLQVEDDGIGISDEQLASPRGMGIRAMRYRANLIEAQLQISSRPGGGTLVQCVVNLGDPSPRSKQTDD